MRVPDGSVLDKKKDVRFRTEGNNQIIGFVENMNTGRLIFFFLFELESGQ